MKLQYFTKEGKCPACNWETSTRWFLGKEYKKYAFCSNCMVEMLYNDKYDISAWDKLPKAKQKELKDKAKGLVK